MALQPFPLTHVLEMRVRPPARALDEESLELYERYGGGDFFDTGAKGGAKGAGLGAGAVTGGAAGSGGASSGTASQFYDMPGSTTTGTIYGPPEFIDGAAPKAPSKNPTDPSKSKEVVFALPIPPTGWTYTYHPAETVTFTQDDAVFEGGRQRLTTIQLQGEVGLKHRLGTDSEGAPRFWDSLRLFGELRAFLRKYWELLGTDAQVELIWRDFKTDFHARVKCDPFTWRIDERNKLSPRWEFQLDAFATVDPVEASPLDEVFKGWRDGVQSVTDAIDTATLYVEIARANIADAFTVITDTLEPLHAIDRLLDSVRGVGTDIGTGRVLVKDTVVQVLGLFDNVLFTLETFIRELGISTAETWFQDAHDALDEAQDAVAAAFVAGALSEGGAAAQSYTVHPGDTLASIAAAAYGSEAEWPFIAAANDLVPPYISDSGLPGTAKPDDTLILPGAAGAAPGGVFPATAAPPSERLFGRDIYRDELTREWALGPTGQDIRRTRGDEAVVQGINARLLTARGKNSPFPSVGIRQLAGQPNHATTAALLLTDVREQLAADDRIETMEEPEGDDRGAAIAVRFAVRLTGGRRVAGLEAASLLAAQVAP